MSRHSSYLGLGLIAIGVGIATITACSGSTSGTGAGIAPVTSRQASPPATSRPASTPAITAAALPAGSAAPSSSVATSSAPKPRATAASTSAASPTAAAPSDKSIKVGKSINDRVFGDKANIVSYVPSFPISPALEKKYSLSEQGKQVLLLQLTVTAGNKYYTTFGKLDFMVLDGSGIPVAESTELVAKDMKAAGYQPLQDANSGQTRTGWVAYFVNAHAKSLTVQYHRLPTKVLGSNKTIPAKNFNLTLPTN